MDLMFYWRTIDSFTLVRGDKHYLYQCTECGPLLVDAESWKNPCIPKRLYLESIQASERRSLDCDANRIWAVWYPVQVNERPYVQEFSHDQTYAAWKIRAHMQSRTNFLH